MGKIEDYYKQFDNCRQKEVPECTSTCPFHFNVLDFQDKMKRNKYDRAYRDYKNAVCFPEIVSALCPEYCNQVCPRKDFDGAVQLNLLEKTCVAKATRKAPTAYNLPSKEGKIGIIGAGASGLACAIKLLEKKYDVVIFEKEKSVGGQLHSLLQPQLFLDDINLQFSKEKYELVTEKEILSLKELQPYGFNAIYVATGKNGNDFDTLMTETNAHCYLLDDVAVFGGGSLVGKDIINSIAQGIDMAWAIEVYIKTKKIDYPISKSGTKVVPNISKIVPCNPVRPTDNNGLFTDVEAEEEASRCIRCQCDICQSECDLVAFSNKWPFSIKEEISMTVVSTESMIHKTPAIRIINTCTQCGLFEESCPGSIEMNNMILESRKLLHKQGKMPPAFHGFWLEDMEQANGHSAKIVRNAPSETESSYAFFPGCHLGAANPQYVEKSYKWLLDNFEKMGLMVRCCGIPADWAGNEDLHNEQIKSIINDWNELGKPVLVTACPSCTKHLQKYLPDIETISIYELMAQKGTLPEVQIPDTINNRDFSIFDPCSARNDNGIKKSIRDLMQNHRVSELPTDSKHGCCGFGGNVEVANPSFAKYVAKQRSSISDNPYITYCINCKDVFVKDGKPVFHVLDLLFGIDINDSNLPNLTQRRKNREILKDTLLMNFYDEKKVDKKMNSSIELEISNEIQEKMDELKLVEENIIQVIENCNTLARRTYNKEKEEYTCYSKLGYITCWVNYKHENNIYIITNLYTHRMDIELEEIWNGRKVRIDL